MNDGNTEKIGYLAFETLALSYKKVTIFRKQSPRGSSHNNSRNGLLKLSGFIATFAVAMMAVAVIPADAARPYKIDRGELLSKADKRICRSAFRAADKAHWHTVRRLVRQAKDPLPGKVLRWLYLSRSGTPAAFEEIAAFIEANPDWPGQDRLARQAERAIGRKVSHERALAWFHRHPPTTTAGRAAFGAALIDTGRVAEGESVLRDAWIGGTFYRRAERAFLKHHGKLLAPEHHLARLDRLLWERRYREARRMLGRVDAGTRALVKARMALRLSSPDVDRLIAGVPQALKRDPGLLYERMRWRRHHNRIDSALEILAAPPEDLVRPEKWWRERRIIVRKLLAKKRAQDAYRVIVDHGMLSGPDFAEAEWMAGWVALRFLDRPREALVHFERMHGVVSFPISLARAAYWAGRAAEASKDQQRMLAWFEKAAGFEATYYGQLARGRLGPRAAPIAVEPTTGDTDFAAFRKAELARAAILLDQLGRGRLMHRFVDRLVEISDKPADLAMTARLAVAIGRVHLGVRVGRLAYRKGVLLRSHGYPVIAMHGSLPEQGLALAVACQESSMNTRAKSSAGARGVMQLMPRTARAVARKLRVKYSRRRLTREPAYNFRLGRAYLRQLLRSYRGSYVLTIAAYNAGPKAVNRWVRNIGDPREAKFDAVDWVEMIPYGHTRNYVQRVLANLQTYRHRLGDNQVAQSLQGDLSR